MRASSRSAVIGHQGAMCMGTLAAEVCTLCGGERQPLDDQLARPGGVGKGDVSHDHLSPRGAPYHLGSGGAGVRRCQGHYAGVVVHVHCGEDSVSGLGVKTKGGMRMVCVCVCV